jgi:hypothetical protein
LGGVDVCFTSIFGSLQGGANSGFLLCVPATFFGREQ